MYAHLSKFLYLLLKVGAAPGTPDAGNIVVYGKTGGLMCYKDDAGVEHELATVADITALVDAAPGALDTLNELAAALGDDANFAATVTTSLAGKQAAIQYKDEAVNLGTSGSVTEVNFTGAGVTASRVGDVVTVNVPGGGGGGGPSLIASATLGAAGTTLTIPTTSFDLATAKRLRVVFKGKNATAVHSGYIKMYFNADTTAANYRSQLGALQGASASASRATGPDVTYMYASSCFDVEGILFLDADGKAKMNFFGPGYDAANSTVTYGTVYYNVVANITGLSIVAPANMTAGTTVEVWSY